MPLTGGDEEIHAAAERCVSLFERCRIGRKRHEFVHIAVDGEKWHTSFSESSEAGDGVVFVEVRAQFVGRHAIGSGGFGDTGVAGDVAKIFLDA